MNCDEFVEAWIEWSLGARPGDVLPNALADHWNHCPSCQSATHELAAGWEALALSLSPVAPTTACEKRLWERIESDSRAQIQPPSQDARRSSANSVLRSWARWGSGLALSLLVVAVLVEVALRSTHPELRELTNAGPARPRPTDAVPDQAAEARLPAADFQWVALKETVSDNDSIHGSVIWDRANGQWHVHIAGLPALETGRANDFQLWLEDAEHHVIVSRVLAIDAQGMAAVLIDLPAEHGTVSNVRITEEPRGGSPKPSGRTLFLGATR